MRAPEPIGDVTLRDVEAEFVWTVSPEQAFGELADFYLHLWYNNIVIVLTRRAKEIEAWMKDNAPWKDQTGNARRTLHTQVIPALSEITLLLSHGMYYGFWLEVKWAGRYSIIGPALDHWVPILMQDLQKMASGTVSGTQISRQWNPDTGKAFYVGAGYP